jgi:hypothetical protein
LVGWVARDPAVNRGAKGLHALAKTVTIRLGALAWLGKRFDAQAKRPPTH